MPDMTKVFAAMFDDECDEKTKEKYKDFLLDSVSVMNTSLADYVWLPIIFEDEIPKLRWFDEWRIEDFQS